MKSKHALVVLVAGVVAVAATTPVAMRVELEPLRQVNGNTEVALVIQIAPVDRSRIGSNAIVRIELDEGRVSSGSSLRAVRAEDDGSFRVLVEWPPGEHDLRVAIEDPNREDTGLWVGAVRIPDLGRGGTVAHETDEPLPESVSASDAATPPVAEPEPELVTPEPAIPATGAEPTHETEAELEMHDPPAQPAAESEPLAEEIPEKAPTAAAATAAAAAAITEAAPSVPHGEPEIAPEREAIEPRPVEPEPEVADASTLEPEPATEPEPVPVPKPEVPDEALAEPLRAEPPAKATGPETVEPSASAQEVPLAAPVSADLAARYVEWGRTDPETREFSVIAMRGREPAEGLEVGDLRLRIGGMEVEVEKLGDSESAPLLLGLLVDVESGGIEGWSGMAGSLAPITDRTGGGRGRLFVADSGGVGDWGAEPGARDWDSGSQTVMNVALQVVASLERFEEERGRSFLVVLTDGRGEPTKDEWQRATDAAGAAGVPILVVALWDDKFSQRTRKNLKKLTVASGGSLFLVQGRSQLASAADRFGRYLDGGYAVRFRMPSDAQGVKTAISVSATDREITVSAPKTFFQ